MATSYGALCSDFYVNQRLGLKLDLPGKRETVLDLFDRIRKFRPAMDRFRRYEGELALEAAPVDGAYDWLALRRTSVRSGSVNPDSLESAYELHRTILEISPYYLTISPIDVDYLELMFGFDLEARGNHDEIVFDALIADTPMGHLIESDRETLIDVQPFLAFALDEEERTEAHFEVKTRTMERSPGEEEKFDDDPISLYLSVRRAGPFDRIDDLVPIFHEMAQHAERLATDKLIPKLLHPITRAISSRTS